MSRICLVGAGNIARTHAEAIASLDGHSIACVIDPNLALARRLAGPGGAAYASLDEALAADGAADGTASMFDRAHVLVPPDLHASVAARLLAAGKPVLLEKPLATSAADCATLLAAAGATPLGVNQNFVHHPAFVRLRALVEQGALGRPRSVHCVYNVALRQMAARQFGHWMFQAPVNILLEQAVHPLSQIAVLAGPIGAIEAMAGPAMPTAPGRAFHPSFTATLSGARLPAQLRFAVGEAFPFWQVTVVGDDGVAVADILADRLLRYGRTRWLEAVDGLLSGVAAAGGLARDSLGNAAGTVLSTLRLRPRSDPFFRSMRDSIAAFHGALDRGVTPALDGAFGAGLVGVCLRLAEAAHIADSIASPDAVASQAGSSPARVAADPPDIAVLGGTGFIGAHVVADLLAHGRRVAVMARSVQNLAAPFDDPRVTLHRGDIRDAAAVARAVAGAVAVVNLAHGGGGATFAEIRDAMLGGAETVARACLQTGARLVHVGSIASLYLGPQPMPITGATPPDPQETQRGDYARAKVLCDRTLLEMHAREGLRVVILRPGIVVGAGGLAFHSGVGFYNTDQHCVGWNEGRNPLPFVLASDVAAAIRLACDAPVGETTGIEGRCYNLAGDVRLSAREYIAALSEATGRPLAFHPQAAQALWAGEMAKWLVKRAGGRNVPPPSLRDLLSRGMRAQLDCGDAGRDLDWRPVAEREAFLDQAVRIHAFR